ncbi:fas apoptotic inhibitory molecule a isoform X1 [Stigmatopora nigra]
MFEDLAGMWEVALGDGIHRIVFVHGFVTGKRVVYVNGKEVLRRDWMFGQVGRVTFMVGYPDTKATIYVSDNGFAYEYILKINGKSMKNMENRAEVMNNWLLNLDLVDSKVVLASMSGDLAGVWEVALSDGVHRIAFEHGTTTGKRVIYVDGKEVLRRDWMFKLVGKETFVVGKLDTKATINIDAVSGFAYEYTLEINGKSLKKYMENRAKMTSTWLLNLDGTDSRVVLEKDTMDIWCNGQKIETAGEFVDDGTETHFSLGDHNCCVKAVSSGKRRDGLIHTLLVDGAEIAECTE